MLEELKEIAKYSIAQSDYSFLAFPDNSISLASKAADILNTFLNQNLITSERGAPLATFIEIQLISWLRCLIGYDFNDVEKITCLDEVGASWMPGGNLSNTVAMMVALNNRFPTIAKDGIQSLKEHPVVLFSEDIAHFSTLNAAKYMGLGTKSVYYLKASGNYTTDIESLQVYLANRETGDTPFILVAVAGNCRTTSIDNIEALYDICEKNNIWLHVDATHGGNLLFSDEYKSNFLRGIEKADSITIDPHKGLFVTYPSSYIIFKNPKHLSNVSRKPTSTQQKNYFDLGLITPFLGSRGFESLKLWLMIKSLGKTGIAASLQKRSAMNNIMVEKIKETNLFMFFNSLDFYRSAFVFLPKQVYTLIQEKSKGKFANVLPNIIDKYTELFSEKLYKQGEVILDIFKLNDINNILGLGVRNYSVIGMSIGHLNINLKLIENIMDTININALSLVQDYIKDIRDFELVSDNKKLNDGPASW